MYRVEQYTRRYGLWRNSHLIDPKFSDIKDLSLPREAIYHHMTSDGVSLGPSMSDPVMQRIEGMRFIEHVKELGKTEVAPLKKLSANINSMMAGYRQRNRSFRPMKSVEKSSGNPKNLLIFNYSMLSAAWRFPISKFSSMYMFKGLVGSFIDHVNSVYKQSSRNQYIIVDLPATLPGIGLLKELGNNLTTSNVEKIPTFEDKFIFELYMYLGRYNQKSLFNKLDKAAIEKTNIIFKHLDKWTVVNLKWLTSFSKALNERGLYEVKQFEVIFLTLLSKLHEAGNPFVASNVQVDDSSDEGIEDDEDDEAASDDSVKERVEEDTQITLIELGQIPLFEDVGDVKHSDIFDDDELDRLEKELSEIETIRTQTSMKSIEMDEEGTELDMSNIPQFDIDMLSSLDIIETDVPASISKAKELLSNGLMTTGEYRRIERITEKFATLKDPYGQITPITDIVEMDLDKLIVDRKPKVDDKVVLDPSIRSANADDFQLQYIEDTLKKNMVQCMTAIQKGPVSVTDYTIEKTIDSVNEFETHIIKLNPTVGDASTIRQIIPIVKPDGTFKYNGVQYRMRMQRVDLPIRKVSPTRVGLTSYYGKVFVEQSVLKRFNYGGSIVNWLRNKIQDAGDKSLTGGSFSNVSNTKVKLPGLYSQIAEEISNFNLEDGTRLSFDYNHRAQYLKLSEEDIKAEPKGGVAFAKKGSTVFYMDQVGLVYKLSKDGFVPSGTFEEMVGLDLTVEKMPVTSVDLQIYSKSIPIGFCLGYLMGLEKLMKLIGAKPRYVNVGERLNLTASEYAIRFKNTSLVFDRKDLLVSLVLSGFNQYHRLIKEYDMATFENKDTYGAILDKLGIGNRYVRKLDSMATYFVDPITEQILTLMKEPISFTGLLVRSCEMLITSYVPDKPEKADPKILGHMERLRGYERLAGFSYETIVKAVEQYSARAATGRGKIVVNPYETVAGLMKDPTVAPINNINPLQYLREREVTTFSGRGGRSKRSMVGSTRVYNEQDTGFISEASVDSGDVGVITYVSQDTNISSVYGTVAEFDPKKDRVAGKMLSTSANLSPNADGDD